MTKTEAFRTACEHCLSADISRSGIGTYKEKTLHAVLKQYIEPDETKQEVSVGSFVADIFNQNGITEIQTRSLNAIRKKLDYFLKDNIVTVVFPMASTKWLIWIDPETGEITKQRKSPKTGLPYHAFPELYKIKQQLIHPNLKLRLILLDIKEYRFLNGWSKDKKKGSSRYERIPVDLVDEIHIECTEDYKKLIPRSLKNGFSSKDFAKAAKMNKNAASVALNVLFYVGAVKRTGKKSRCYIYEITR